MPGNIIDISLSLGPDLLVWPGDPPVVVERVADIATGDPANVSLLCLGSHTGTHVDPPAHFIPGGATVDQLAIDVLVGEAMVADATGRPGPLGPADLDALDVPRGTERLLLRTDNSTLWTKTAPRRGRPVRRDLGTHVASAFPDHYVALSPAGARWLVERGVRLVGIDFLSIEAADAPGHPVHLTLLSAGVVILEGLDLSGVAAGPYLLACLPLRLAGGDGGPARAVLVDRRGHEEQRHE